MYVTVVFADLVVLIGDSIRMGYQPGVIDRLKGWADVWGPEQNCRHSIWALDHFQEWVVSHKPDILSLLLSKFSLLKIRS